MSTYFSIPTEIGEAKIANALALGVPLKLTHMGVGDGNGVLPVPDRKQVALVREQRRAPINTLDKDPKNASQIIIEQVLPADVGGWWVREIGVYDEAGDLCAVANCPPSYKPVITEGAGKDQVVRVVLLVASTAAVELKIDPAVVLATRKYADEAIVAYAAPKGHTHPDLAPLKSPALTGTPTTPTPATAASDQQVTNVEFVLDMISKAIDGVVPFFTAIPAQKVSDVIMVKGIGMMEWIDIAGAGEFHGYRSLRCGALEFGTTTAPRPYEADLVGGLGSKTGQASIWAWAQQNGHAVAAATWTTKVFKFADVDANTFRFPDLRDVFARFAGTDADSGQAVVLGSYKADTLKSHYHSVGKPGTVQGGTGGSAMQGGGSEIFSGTTGSAETAPKHTAFMPRIHL
ncbi:bacteriophage variable tail fiber protein [Herbaspirillum rubrisubalbicans M1]|uniref:phage tail protein n=1 Tax=Herbaspirillum rubrisubalbicans TaxID=80842 RepID=UPI00073AD844|nr:phage tail protein [Herbaspirillum rubrisubalbicans]ALU88618.1 bacteriophage variable tail fiber protein [Herbaspirillum rubrisubalbicans M1]